MNKMGIGRVAAVAIGAMAGAVGGGYFGIPIIGAGIGGLVGAGASGALSGDGGKAHHYSNQYYK